MLITSRSIAHVSRAACLAVLGLSGTAFAQIQPSKIVAGPPAQAGSRKAAPPEPAEPGYPRREPPDSQSARLRAEQADRKAQRELLDWSNLDPSIQELLWDDLVGPDQLNDGFGRARVRPSLRPGGVYGGGGYTDRGDDPDSPLVDLSWVYTPVAGGATSSAYDLNLNFEGDVALVGTNTVGEVLQIKAIELKGTADATEGYVENWSRTFAESTSDPDGYLQGRSAASDLLGNTFVVGARGTDDYYILKLNGQDGSTITRLGFSPEAQASSVLGLRSTIDPEGILYVAGEFSSNFGTGGFVARHNPGTLARDWIHRFNSFGAPMRVETDRFGNVYVFSSRNLDSVPELHKLSAIDGTVEWTWTGPSGTGAVAVDLDLDFQGNPHVLYSNTSAPTSWNTVKIDAKSGTAIWSAAVADGRASDMKIDQDDGDVFVVGNQGSNTFKLVKYDFNGVAPPAFVSPQYGTTGGAVRVAIDWAGNPYVAGAFGTTSMTLDVRKFDGQDGGEAWRCVTISPKGALSENNTQLLLRDFIVDAGGSVYLGGARWVGQSGTEFFCVRWEQPYVEVPLISTSNASVRVEDHSVWLPHVDEGSALDAFNNTFPLFDLPFPNIEAQIDDLLSTEVNYVAGTVRGAVDLDLINNPSIGVDFVTAATGGTFDAEAAGKLTMLVPPTIYGGTAFDITLEFTPDPAATSVTANAQPEFSASLKSDVHGDVNLTVTGENRNGGIFGADFEPIFSTWNVLPADFNLESSLDNRTILQILGAAAPEPGTWVDFEVHGVEGRLTMPDLRSKGVYSALQNSGANAGNANDDDVMRLTSSASSTFCDLGVSITDMVSPIPLSFAAGLPASESGTDASLSIGLVQAGLSGNMKMEQDLTMDIKPYVRLEFPGTSIATRTVDLVKRQTIAGGYKFVPEAPVTITPPASGVVEVKPTFGVRSKMRNESGIRFGADASFNAFELDVGLSLLDVNVFSLYECWGCYSQPIFSTRVDLYDNSVIPNGYQEFSWPEAELSSVRVPINPDVEPLVIGASRASARMIIYDQSAPSQANLTAIALGDEPMVIYGRKFFTGTGQANRAFIKHHGRQEQLTTTRLNDQALLVKVPKRFFLLPGTARIWVTNGNGSSKSFDFPIEYPFPNFQGVESLDGATNPALWAGDPRRAFAPLVLIDGGTPGGNDSFLTRRDYYTLLRTTLWNPGLFPFAHPSANLSAQEYFPSFGGWELPGNPKVPPAFPTLVFDGVALGRKPGAATDGRLRVMLPNSLYSTPHVASLSIVNPGPGGGPSRELQLTIPAPAPVISRLSPAAIAPGSVVAGGSLRLTVFGPDSVPYFAGYEAVKAGNFTPESIVQFNGLDMPTEFVNSGQLVAYIPDTLLTSVGARLVTVSTPSGGTTFVEQQRLGTGTQLLPHPVNSGGISVPMTFDVVWDSPVIRSLSPDTMQAGHPPEVRLAVDGVPPTDDHNFSINGRHFAPGCRVFWNGRALSATRDSDRTIRATVTPLDLLTAGNARVVVVNPSPSARTSLPFTVVITP